MREKRLRLIITFHTTAAAMALERLCGERDNRGVRHGVDGRRRGKGTNPGSA